jgi:hypothetical protein
MMLSLETVAEWCTHLRLQPTRGSDKATADQGAGHHPRQPRSLPRQHAPAAHAYQSGWRVRSRGQYHAGRLGTVLILHPPTPRPRYVGVCGRRV